ncbi:MAG TPA: N-acetyl-gamma-glutamyl-phosphate reductase [Bryobacteraceae bacterium]|nr:N-acetyl-gamma-glutamyl-phosphate reductase [Bryobacteraceae bacterium]
MHNHSRRHTVGVVGFRGYSGAELVRILARHPAVEVLLLEHRPDSEQRPSPLGQKPPKVIPATVEAMQQEKLDLVFLATPADVSIALAPAILQSGTRVIDLSGAFRLRDGETYSRWYKERHTAPELLSEAVYGLPEFYREQIRGARFIANPGCYPTAANLAIRPLLDAQVVDRSRGIICDAKSGVSGAGRKPSLKTSFCEVTGNFSAYGIVEHRHVPEVLQNSGLGEREFTFAAHLIPVERGILETIYLRTDHVEKAVDLLSIYEDFYAEHPFVRLYAPGKLPDLHAVQHTNFCDIGFVFDAESQRAVIVSAEDNLGKGAAGQAVQNMNLALGFAETEALL